MGAFIKVESSKCNAYIPLKERITFLRGDSVVGKSSIVSTILEHDENRLNIHVDTTEGYDIFVISSGNSIGVQIIDIARKSILIADSVTFHNMKQFISAIGKLQENDSYLLLISREDILGCYSKGCNVLIASKPDFTSPDVVIESAKYKL